MRLCPHCSHENLRPLMQRLLVPVDADELGGDQRCDKHGIVRPSDQEVLWHIGFYLRRKAPCESKYKTRLVASSKRIYVRLTFLRWSFAFSAYRCVGNFVD